MLEEQTGKVAQWTLRKLAPRVLEVFDRQRGLGPVVTRLEATLLPAATDFIAVYDQSRSIRNVQRLSRDRQHVAADKLCRHTNLWLAYLQRDVPGFDAGMFGAREEAPDAAINRAQGVLNFITNLSGNEGPVAYAQDLIADLMPTIATTIECRAEAQRVLVQKQELQSTVRTHAVGLERELETFRTALRLMLGDRHRDVHQLTPSNIQRDPAELAARKEKAAKAKAEKAKAKADTEKARAKAAEEKKNVPVEPAPVAPVAVLIEGPVLNGKSHTEVAA